MIDKERMKAFLSEVGYIRMILLLVCGVFLLVVSMPKKKEEILVREETFSEQQNITDKNDIYIEKMEKKLKNTLSKMKGVGDVEVMITLAASSETVVNKDETVENKSEITEGEEAKKHTSSMTELETVMMEEDGQQKPYIIKEVEPVVEGVIIVMEGGDNTIVVNAVTEAVLALFQVESHKIKVLKMEDAI